MLFHEYLKTFIKNFRKSENKKRFLKKQIKKQFIKRGFNNFSKYFYKKEKEIYGNKKDKIYLASADEINGLKESLKHNLPSCKKFYTVVGGMGCLNILPKIPQLEEIHFFDVNKYQLEVARIYIKIIKISKNREDFVSNFYLREFNEKKYPKNKQREFFRKPLEKKRLHHLKEALGKELYNLYIEMFLPYIKYPLKNNYDGPTTHCTKLPLYYKGKKLVQTFYKRKYIKKEKIESINTLYYGEGWLENEESFKKTKEKILENKIFIYKSSIFDLDPPKNSGLYSSNIFGGEEKNFAKKIHDFKWAIFYDPKTDQKRTKIIKSEKEIKFEEIVGKDIMNPHKTSCMILNKNFNLNKNYFLEICFKNTGFVFYKGFKRISPENFEKLTNQEKIPGIMGAHILLGNGLPPKKWKKIVKKMVSLNKNLFIFEHRKECSDFEGNEKIKKNLLSEKEIDNFLLSLNSEWIKYGTANKKGDPLDIRNLCYILKKPL